MGDEASRVVQDVDATLRKWQIKLGRDFFELGRELDITHDFIHDLNGVGVRLSDTRGDYSQGIDAKRMVANARVQGLLGSLLDFLSDLVRTPRGSDANTLYAQEKLDALLAAVAQLRALDGEPPVTVSTSGLTEEEFSSTLDEQPVDDEADYALPDATQVETTLDPPPTDPEPATTFQKQDPSQYDLTHYLADYFTIPELRDLCLSLDIPYSRLSQSDTLTMAQEMVDYARRHGKHPALVAEVKSLRSFLFH